MSKFRRNNEFVFNSTDFPELHGINTQQNPINVSDPVCFIDAISKNHDEPNPLPKLKRGWVGISKDEKGKTIYTNSVDKPDSDEEITPLIIIKKMELYRERFKQQFIELNGVDEYDKIYVNYQQYESSDEDVIDSNLSDDENEDIENKEEYDDY
jgi:hypothetical protein